MVPQKTCLVTRPRAAPKRALHGGRADAKKPPTGGRKSADRVSVTVVADEQKIVSCGLGDVDIFTQKT
eukprot:3284021-Prymnesium_polylepis.1